MLWAKTVTLKKDIEILEQRLKDYEDESFDKEKKLKPE